MRGARQAATVATGFVPGVAPPVPSDYYRTDPDSTRGNDIASQAYRTALANYRRWQDAHSAAQVEVVAWLASSGVLGAEARAAHVAYVGQANIVKTAEDAVRAAQAREDEAKEKLAEGVRAARLDPKGRLAARRDRGHRRARSHRRAARARRGVPLGAGREPGMGPDGHQGRLAGRSRRCRANARRRRPTRQPSGYGRRFIRRSPPTSTPSAGSEPSASTSRRPPLSTAA